MHSALPSATTKRLTRVPWYQWSIVRLAGIAMGTVLIGYVVAAVMAMQSIDQLLHMVHDDEVEWAMRYGMEQARTAYSAQQIVALERLQHQLPGKSISTSQLDQQLRLSGIGTLLAADSWKIADATEQGTDQWLDRHRLQFKDHVIEFSGIQASESYRRAETIVQRYQVIGLELRDRIRPALIRALSMTLAVMCALLLIAFIYMTWRLRKRVQSLIDGFVRYTDVDDRFRFYEHWHSELGLIGQQFNRMADDLAENRARAVNLEKLASWQTIARKMAHEIKNPLTPIQIMIGQLKRNYHGSDDKYQKLVDNAHKVILEEVASLRRMVDDFSEFARLPRAELVDCDLIATAEKAVALASSAYAPHTIVFDSTLAALNVPHDEQLMRHVIHNLIKNAAEADAQSPTTITVRIAKHDSSAVITVHDHGPGIPKELQHQIFEAYVTTKHTGPTPGMGLGLAICQKVVLEHGGRLYLESKPGDTIFTISIPLQRKGTIHG